MSHLQEINELQALSMPEHLTSSRIAQAMKTRYPVTLCNYSHEVLMHFLQGSRLYLILGIINDHLKIKVIRKKLPRSSANSHMNCHAKRHLKVFQNTGSLSSTWGSLSDK